MAQDLHTPETSVRNYVTGDTNQSILFDRMFNVFSRYTLIKFDANGDVVGSYGMFSLHNRGTLFVAILNEDLAKQVIQTHTKTQWQWLIGLATVDQLKTEKAHSSVANWLIAEHYSLLTSRAESQINFNNC